MFPYVSVGLIHFTWYKLYHAFWKKENKLNETKRVKVARPALLFQMTSINRIIITIIG